MKIRFFILQSFVLTALACSASSPADEELSAQDSYASWTFSAGPAWRSRVKMESRGRVAAESSVPRSTSKRDMFDSDNWGRGEARLVRHPQAGTGTIAEDDELWGLDDTRVETYGVDGLGCVVKETDERSSLGVNLQVSYDLCRTESLSLSLAMRLACYWNLKSSTSGRFDAGTMVTEVWTDHYVFPEEAPDAPFDPDPEFGTIAESGSTLESVRENDNGSRTVSMRFCGDLYQVGIGPKVSWSPFAEEGTSGWLDIYCGVELLGNIAHSEFSADGLSNSETSFLPGAGGMLGVVGKFSDQSGVFGRIGYEWLDDSDLSVGRFRISVDYSSLVVTAGLLFQF